MLHVRSVLSDKRLKYTILILILWFENALCLVGGKNVSILQAPFQANYADKCGAVVIHSRWLLTTAHCGAEGTFIRVGSSHRLHGTKVQVQRHLIHPEFEEGQFDYDVQLLRVYKELQIGRRLRSVEICGDYGEKVKVFGWGYEKEKGDYHDQLQMIEVSVVNIGECEVVSKLLQDKVQLTPRMFCAKGVGQDACQGDSGGAATSSGQLVGLSSFGYGCGRGYPGVYTSVTESSIRNWIRTYTGI